MALTRQARREMWSLVAKAYASYAKTNTTTSLLWPRSRAVNEQLVYDEVCVVARPVVPWTHDEQATCTAMHAHQQPCFQSNATSTRPVTRTNQNAAVHAKVRRRHFEPLQTQPTHRAKAEKGKTRDGVNNHEEEEDGDDHSNDDDDNDDDDDDDEATPPAKTQ